ncbi:alpha/beta-hydrolase [Whalleya microplaca]|nr:alpha/beta-hydrolase [Whalleya microplaca]
MGHTADQHQSGIHSSGTSIAQTAVEFAHQAEKLSHHTTHSNEHPESVAVEAQFITPQDPVIVTADGNRLPAVPLEEAHKLNSLKDELNDEIHGDAANHASDDPQTSPSAAAGESSASKLLNVPSHAHRKALQKSAEGSLHKTMPPSNTNPLFPPLPLYGPPSLLRDLQCMTFRVSSFFLSAAFLGVIVLGALFTSIPSVCYKIWLLMTLRNPDSKRPFYEEECRRKQVRKEQEKLWKKRKSQDRGTDQESSPTDDGYVPTEGGPDPVVCDVGYYARRVGLDVEEYEVQTEDGFIIDLWHVYDPREYTRLNDEERSYRGPDLFTGDKRKRLKDSSQKKKFPVLLMHGLLQSAGAYCVNDDDSLAFYLCKSGYDVWLGNNRCGFKPKHVLLEYSDPRMWCWNIRQMGVLDLSALTSRVLFETEFEKIGLICHSQGTTETFVALAKEQRPELGEKLTVFCALAPAAYAGPLIGKMYFKFMRIISPALFRLMFGIHAFIPLMMTMHRILHTSVYGWLGYKVFSFLFDWTDQRWERDLRNRMFQFAPVYVSAESMRWWLGRECFAKHKCILSTKEQWRKEDREDGTDGPLAETDSLRIVPATLDESGEHHQRRPKGSTAWYNEQICPFAMWVAGNDDLVDGKKLLQRFERGREPYVNIVHSKVLPEYEHLDVIWAMDAVDQIFQEIREVLWKTCNVRDECRVPKGCENVPAWTPGDGGEDGETSQSGSD